MRSRAAAAGPSIRFFLCNTLGDDFVSPIQGPDTRNYDAIVCSLFLHHLDKARRLLCCARMAERTGQLVLVNDLERGWTGLLAAHVVTRILTRSSIIHIDCPRSVEAPSLSPRQKLWRNGRRTVRGERGAALAVPLVAFVEADMTIEATLHPRQASQRVWNIAIVGAGPSRALGPAAGSPWADPFSYHQNTVSTLEGVRLLFERSRSGDPAQCGIGGSHIEKRRGALARYPPVGCGARRRSAAVRRCRDVTGSVRYAAGAVGRSGGCRVPAANFGLAGAGA